MSGENRTRAAQQSAAPYSLVARNGRAETTRVRVGAAVVRLLNERARLAGVIGRAKKVSGLSIHAPEREESVLRNVAELAEGRFGSREIERVFRTVIEERRRAEEGSE